MVGAEFLDLDTEGAGGAFSCGGGADALEVVLGFDADALAGEGVHCVLG